VRPAIYVAAVCAAAALAPELMRNLLANAASIVLEALPFLAFAAFCGGFGRLARYAGCGCGTGPSARSLPAALATALTFGWAVACVRFAGALLAARCMHRAHDDAQVEFLVELARLAPSSILAAATALISPALPLHAFPPWCAFAVGLVLGAIASPCALGGIAIAASIRTASPLAAAGVLCTAGVIDIYAFGLLRARDCVRNRGDAQGCRPRASALHAAARGNGALLPGAIAAALILALVIGAPAPEYRATETSLADAFPGERVTFAGVAVHEHAANALVRYAILCCRADARPIALAVDRDLRAFDGCWLRVDGVLARMPDGTLRLRMTSLARIAPPSDPFVYR
jgi:hypothetical protein